ncbi:hypothetical protein D3C75_785050 [compost metagenome]
MSGDRIEGGVLCINEKHGFQLAFDNNVQRRVVGIQRIEQGMISGCCKPLLQSMNESELGMQLPIRQMLGFVDQYTDEAGFLVRERAGCQVRNIAELFGQFHNLAASLLGNGLITHTVQHIAYGGNGYVGPDGDVLHSCFFQQSNLLSVNFLKINIWLGQESILDVMCHEKPFISWY